jgi:hypothetical protein
MGIFHGYVKEPEGRHPETMNDMDVGDKATNESNDWDHSGRLISMGAGITMDYCSPNVWQPARDDQRLR